jgi:hypothetical protein
MIELTLLLELIEDGFENKADVLWPINEPV